MAKLGGYNNQLSSDRAETRMNIEEQKPRLLVLTSTFPRWDNDVEPGFVFELTKRMADQFQITVLCPHAPGALATEARHGIQIYRYRYAPAPLESLVNNGGIIENIRKHKWKILLTPSFALSQALWIWRLTKKNHIDVIHAHWIIPQGLIATTALAIARRRRPAMLITSHGADLFALRSPPMKWLKRLALKRADAISVVSPAMKSVARDLGTNPSKLYVEPMGVDLSNAFTPGTSIKRSKDEVLFVGRIVEKKGLRHLIEAMPLVIAQRPNAFLTIAGFGPDIPNCKRAALHANIADRVHFIGPVDQSALPDLYRRAAVFAAPFIEARSGDQDGLGLVLIEALGCGCPVVVSDIPATRSLSKLSPSIIVEPWSTAQELARLVVSGMSISPTPPSDTLLRSFDWAERASAYKKLITKIIKSR